MYDLINNTWGNKTFDICNVLNERAPLTIRANLLKTSRDDLYYSFKKQGYDVEKTEFSPYGITFRSLRSNIFNMDEFRKGMFEVQDEGSQLASLRVDCKVKIINLAWRYCTRLLWR
jgi:16S rRNA (cytosine967-C5)-methyltransferase